MTASSRGNYYKLRTKRWLEAKGYTVAFMERVGWIPPKRPGDRMIPVKRDQFGSDLLAMNHEEIVFIQVKFGASRIAAGHLADARREFAKYVFPPGTQRWIVTWQLREREPKIEDCSANDQPLFATGGR